MMAPVFHSAPSPFKWLVRRSDDRMHLPALPPASARPGCAHSVAVHCDAVGGSHYLRCCWTHRRQARRYPQGALRLGLAIAIVAGCEGESSVEGPNDRELLAQVDLYASTIEFGVADDGTIFVSEYGPVDAPSPLTYLLANKASALEMYLAITEDGSNPPRELVESHQRVAARTGTPARARNLDVPDEDAFRAHWTWYYSANCSLASDGAWFDTLWAGSGFEYHVYRNFTANSDGVFAAIDEHLIDSTWLTHLCVHSGYTDVNHYAYKWPGGGGGFFWNWAKLVDPGFRSTLMVEEPNPPASFGAQAQGILGGQNVKLGAMAPD
jgi:hypothetical protein